MARSAYLHLASDSLDDHSQLGLCFQMEGFYLVHPDDSEWDGDEDDVYGAMVDAVRHWLSLPWVIESLAGDGLVDSDGNVYVDWRTIVSDYIDDVPWEEFGLRRMDPGDWSHLICVHPQDSPAIQR